MAISKIKEDVENFESELLQPARVSVSGLPRVKQIIRWISKMNYSNPEANFWSVQEVDAYINSWLEQGYALFNTHYIGDNPEGYGVLYILVLK
jgi:two-component SAPR family response regulator